MRVNTDLITCYVVRPTADGSSHEFLQLRRRAGDFMGGTWQTVSGGIEPGETAWQAALRELREEAGLGPDEFYELPLVNTFYTVEHETLWHSVTFCAVVSRGRPVVLNDEHDALRWVPRERADAEFMWPTDRAAVAELGRTILDDGNAKAHLRIELE